MKHFLSGFSDTDAALILKHCAQVLTPDGRILLLQVCCGKWIQGARQNGVCMNIQKRRWLSVRAHNVALPLHE
jgi:hypothetical protein